MNTHALETSSRMTMKPWYLYTAEDDKRLYEEDFDLEALLCPSPAGGVQEPEVQETQLVSPTIQASSNPEDSRLVQVCPEDSPLVLPLTPPEESLLVRELREQLELMRTQFDNQVQITKSLDLKLKNQERLAQKKDLELQKKDKQLQDQIKAHKDIRYLYNRAVQDNVQLKQQLSSTNSAPEKIKEKDLELVKVNVALQKKEQQLEEQTQAHKDIRYLYNTAIQEKVQLKQQLASANSVTKTLKEKLSQQDLAMAELKKQARSEPESCSCSTRAEQEKEKEPPTTNTEAVGEVTERENEELSRRVQDLSSKLHSSQEKVFFLTKKTENLEPTLKKSESQSSQKLKKLCVVEEQRRLPRRQKH